MKSLYSPLVLDHYRHPRNFGKLNEPTHVASELNPLCGDEIKVYLKIENSKIENCRYEARGCALAIAAASVLSEKIKGLSIRELKKMNLSAMENLLKIKVGAARESCVALASRAVLKALN